MIAPGVSRDADVALMLRVSRDEAEAFAELVRTFQPRVFAILCRILGDRQEAEDLSQEVFLRLFRSRKSYEPRAQLSTWVFHIAQNVARNALRRRRRHAWLRYGCLSRTEAQFPDRFAATVSRPIDTLEFGELAQQLRQALRGLRDHHRQALELQHYHDCSYPEIATALSLTPKAAKSLLYRARLELRRLLEAPASDS